MNSISGKEKSLAARKLGSVLVMLLAMLWASGSSAKQLPVFKLAKPEFDSSRAIAILESLRGRGTVSEIESEDQGNVFVARAGSKEVEIYKASGGVFMRDSKQLWNPELDPDLPSYDKAKVLADRFLASNKLLPSDDPHIRVSLAKFSETGVATDSPKQVNKKVLDIQANYRINVVIESATGHKLVMPVVGGGGDFKVAIGDRGAVIGFLGVWRPIVDIASTEEILPKARAEARFKKMAGNTNISKIRSFLAYYSAPAFERQNILAPVWVVMAEAKYGDHTVRLRNAIIAATKYGPAWPDVPVKDRSQEEKPRPGSLDRDERQQQSWLDRLIAPAFAQNPSEAGTSWIGPSQGLAGSPANAQGFVDGLAAGGWDINFNWGEQNAWESDWNSDDDNWVDATDFVFYTGHASSDGWVLNSPNDTFLDFNEVGTTPGNPNDHYGQRDLEWIIIAACGPHQSSHFVGGIGNAFDRWRGIFDGLHIFLGYGAVTFDNTTEGSRVVALARSGWTVIDAWFRAAWEIQPSNNGYGAPDGPVIFVTAMYAKVGSQDTRNDHIWGAGSVASDPRNPGQQRYLMWTGT
ncbi:MAG: DUF6345 domain-containing protein [Nitrococcus sp.]|nr:DUF6345 domain-containing protein [Nitrococcus sp.]